MKKIEVNTADGANSLVYVGESLINDLKSLFSFNKYSRIFVLTEPGIKENLLHFLQKGVGLNFTVIEVPSGEETKCTKGVELVWQGLVDGRADRKSLLINFGGGMITDLGGFAASTYMRGIDFINIPTTLLAQVDASIGGKNGINFYSIKNCIGTFNQAVAVIVDVAALKTLPKREISSGMAEVIKHGAVFDKGYFKQIEELPDLENFTPEMWQDIIFSSCHIKKDIVSKDEKESGSRKLLNFGHTAGHAIESLSHRLVEPLLHGEAISIGMVIEAHLSNLPTDDINRLKKVLVKNSLPVTLPVGGDYEFSELYKLIESDKKNVSGNVSWTLLKELGSGCYDQHRTEDDVKAAFQSVVK